MVLQCELYNAALEERTMTYEWLKGGLSTKKVPSLFDQFKTLTGLRELRPEFGPFGISVCRGTLTRLDEAFQGYFRRTRAGEKPGYPRFRSVSRVGLAVVEPRQADGNSPRAPIVSICRASAM